MPITICGLFLTACQQIPAQRDPIPVLSPKNEAEALVILQKRAAEIHTLSAKCRIKLTATNGKTDLLDGSLMLAPPNQLQFIGMKNSQVVLSVTFRPNGLWVQAANSIVNPSAFTDMMRLLLWSCGNYFYEPSLVGALMPMPGQPSEFEYDVAKNIDSAVVCEVETTTVTPRKYSLLDELAAVRLSVQLSEYRPFGLTVWPMHIVGSGKEIGTIDLTLSNVQINGQLDPHAFDPPAGAMKQ